MLGNLGRRPKRTRPPHKARAEDLEPFLRKHQELSGSCAAAAELAKRGTVVELATTINQRARFPG